MKQIHSLYFEGVLNQPSVVVNGISYVLKASAGSSVIDCAKHTITKNSVNLLGAWESTFPTLNVGKNTVSLPQNCRMVWKEKYSVV